MPPGLAQIYKVRFTSGKHSAKWVWIRRPSGSYFLTRSPSPTRSSSSQLGTNLGVTTGATKLLVKFRHKRKLTHLMN